MTSVIKYEHHGKSVAVLESLRGRHKEHCLCYLCKKFHPNTDANCATAQSLYDFDRQHGITTPVWECEHFEG